MSEMLTLEAFEEASIKVKEVTQETKLVESPYLTAATGNRVWLKPENMQRTGAYKVRGAYYTRFPPLRPKSSRAASSPPAPATTPKASPSPPRARARNP